MKKKIIIIMMGVLCIGGMTGCGRTDFSSDIVIIESEEPIEIAGNRYLSERENYYYTFYEDGSMYLCSLNKKYEFHGTYQTDGDSITLSAKNTDGEESTMTYTMKHGEKEQSVVMVTEDGQKFLLQLTEPEDS